MPVPTEMARVLLVEDDSLLFEGERILTKIDVVKGLVTRHEASIHEGVLPR